MVARKVSTAKMGVDQVKWTYEGLKLQVFHCEPVVDQLFQGIYSNS